MVEEEVLGGEGLIAREYLKAEGKVFSCTESFPAYLPVPDLSPFTTDEPFITIGISTYRVQLHHTVVAPSPDTLATDVAATYLDVDRARSDRRSRHEKTQRQQKENLPRY